MSSQQANGPELKDRLDGWQENLLRIALFIVFVIALARLLRPDVEPIFSWLKESIAYLMHHG